MPLYAPWPARTTKFPNTIEQFPGLLDVDAGAGSPGIPLQNLGWLAWAAMDGIVPYSAEGRQTFMYWTLGDGTGKGPGAGETIPTVVSTWLAAFHRIPVVIVALNVAQDTTPDAGAELSYVSDLWNYLVRVRRIEDAGTSGSWVPPGGGTAFPPEPAIPSGASDALSQEFWLQDQANQRYELITQRWAGTLGTMPNSPYPAIGSSSQAVSSQDFNGVNVDVGGSQVVSASRDAAGNVTLISSRVTGYDPSKGVTSQGSTALAPPGSDQALPFMQLTTGAQVTPSTPAVLTSAAGPKAPGAASGDPGLTPSVDTNRSPVTVDWQKWGAVAGIGASIAVVLLAIHSLGGRK